jgi:hypothetical protein
MRLSLHPLKRALPASRRNAPSWLRNERGATAVEFGIVVVPFFLFVLSILGVGLYFFTINSLEHGAEAAARQIRTGQAQKGALTVGEFRQLVCEEAGTYIDCNKLHVLVQNASSWSGITPDSCLDQDKNLTASTGDADEAIADYTGQASQVVLVTLCYEWDLAKSFKLLKLGKNTDGSGAAVLQAATAFRTEPYS